MIIKCAATEGSGDMDVRSTNSWSTRGEESLVNPARDMERCHRIVGQSRVQNIGLRCARRLAGHLRWLQILLKCSTVCEYLEEEASAFCRRDASRASTYLHEELGGHRDTT
jgi:hypothetical protein